MKNPLKFNISVIVSFITLLILYLPVAIVGFSVFGSNTNDNIIHNLNDNWLKIVVIVLITGHLLTAFTIILNPLFQGFEKMFKIPSSNSYSFKLK